MSNETENMPTEITPKPSQGFPKIGCIILTLIILALIFSVYLTYCYVKKSDMKLTHAVGELQEVQKQNTTMDLQKNLEVALQSIQQLQNDMKQLQQNMTEITQSSQQNKNTLDVQEAHYYVKLANVELQYANNIPLAVTLLKQADDRMKSLSDPKLDDIRKALANDIANLQSVQALDLTGIYMRLMALNNQIDQLQLPTKIAPANQLTEKNGDQQKVWWKRGLDSTWQALQKIVVVRYSENDVLPLVTPDQQQFLYQNCHAMIQQSIWALLHHETLIYQTSLQQLTAWVKKYFVSDSSLTQAFLSDVNQLQAIDIHPKSPDITDSLQAFDSVSE